MTVITGPDQLRRDAHPLARLHDRAFHDRIHVQLSGDLLQRISARRLCNA